jgi:predicted enzyme related to lactoylglutathione lyase
MVRFDHLTIPVASWTASRDWYVQTLGLTVEFESPDAKTTAVRDQHDFTIFLAQGTVPTAAAEFALYFQVEDVQQSYKLLSERAVAFNHPPQRAPWGFGAELLDPNGYAIRLWDERSMKAHE